MVREKKPDPPIDDLPHGEDMGDAVPVIAPAAPPAPVQTRTRDRDPANRLAWKRERAHQLGHDRK